MRGTAVHDQRRVDGAPAPAQRTDGVELAVYDNLDAVEPEWRRFQQTADATVFQTFDWLSLWLEHVGQRENARPVIVVGRDRNGVTLFILPLMVVPGGVRRLSWLGSDLCDYNGPLLAPDFSTQITPERFATLWRDISRLAQATQRYDLVELTKMAPTVAGQQNPLLALPVAPNPCNAYVADLYGPWEKFYETKRSSATRRRDRTKLKRLGELGAVHFATAQDGDDARRSIVMLAEQKARTFARMGAPNMFDYPGWRAFYTAVATSPRTRDIVHVSRLEVGATAAAINLGLIFRDSYYHILVSHDDGDAVRFGPGVAHLRELMRYAIERGLTKFDFTIGDERYKSEWADHKVPLYDHTAVASARGAVALPVVVARRRVKRLIKQNETLWSWFSRARAAVGARFLGAKTISPPPLAPK